MALRYLLRAPDTIYGVSYAALAPEHKIVKRLLDGGKLEAAKAERIRKILNQVRANAKRAKKTDSFWGSTSCIR